jgi:hypothetical protein
LERNGRWETGRKFFRSLGSREGFFSKGITIADLNTEGKIPVDRELFTTEVI